MIHRYSVTIGGKARSLELEELGGGAVRVVVDGRERRIDARQVEPGVWSLVDPETGRNETVQLEGATPALTVEVDGVIFGAEITDARTAGLEKVAHRTSAGGGGPATLRSPMPGRVVKVLAKVGDHVTAAQGVVVVEAMKMENELRAPRDGTVKEIRCQEGATVEAGQELAIIA